MLKSDSIIDMRKIYFLNEIRNKYGIKREDEVIADSLLISEAFQMLKSMPDSFKLDFCEDLRGMALSDNVYSREEAMYMLAVIACFTNRISEQSVVVSIELPENVSRDTSQVLYVEGEFYKDTNHEIVTCYREIVNELRLIGLNFVYIPNVGNHYNSLPKDELNTLISFIYPSISDVQMLNVIKQLTSLSTSDFCKSELIGHMKIGELEHSLPSIMFRFGDSYIKGKIYSNYLIMVIEENALSFIRKIADSFGSIFKPRILNPVYEEGKRFVYSGFHKQIFDALVYKKGIRSRIVVDVVHGDIILPEAEIKIAGLYRREKALYALFLLESSTGGINFNKPLGKKSLEKYNRRMGIIQNKYEIIYENFGGERSKAPIIENPETRLPMISHIKRQFRQLGDLLNQPDDYLIQRNQFGNYCVTIPPELCQCFDMQSNRICSFEESNFWSRLLAM